MTADPAPSWPGWLSDEDVELIASRYRIVREAARGGMGVVYEAIYQPLDMKVAVKIIRLGHSLDRFQREGKILARIRSPHVVSVHSFEMLPSGVPMLVMEWIEGCDLREAMESGGGRIPEREALPTMRDTCLGMLAVEEEGIVHRDLKPSNILLDRRGMARVADFGLARPEFDAPDSALTLEGSLMGTPLYMAPEQAENPAGADTRSDIYSFGATYYHALTGTAPFEGDSYFKILFLHKTEPLVSPIARCRELSGASSELLERCLAKSPNDRFQSFRDILDLIDTTGEKGSPWNEVNDAALVPYITRYQERRAHYLEEWLPPGEVDLYQFPEGREIRIVAGDIAAQKVEAVVSSDDYRLSMAGGSSLSILKGAGSPLVDEAAIYVPVRPGRAVVTSAGNLEARFVFHGVTMGLQDRNYLSPSRDIILEIMKSCLYHAETLNVRSIAFPLLGTGAGGFSKEVCLDAMFLYLSRMMLRGLTPLEDVRLVLYTPDVH
jgi:serine/threonine protein kinase